MRHLSLIAAAFLVSTALYAVAYWVVLDFPLRFAYQGIVFDAKERYARRVAEQPKLVVLSGSNSLFGVSCAAFGRATGRICVNGGTAATFDLFYTVDLLKPYLRRGDVVYMPLEYNFYLEHTSPAFVGNEALPIVMRDKRKLLEMPLLRAIHVLFYLDMAMALRAVGEMIRPARLARAIGRGRRVNEYGDMLETSAKTGDLFRWYVMTVPSYVPRFNRSFRSTSGNFMMRLGHFLDWCRERGIIVVGGLPVAFDDAPVSDDAIARLRTYFAAHKQQFLVLENRSQYPRRLFFDREFHLNENGRIAHTVRLVEAFQRRKLLPAPAPMER